MKRERMKRERMTIETRAGGTRTIDKRGKELVDTKPPEPETAASEPDDLASTETED